MDDYLTTFREAAYDAQAVYVNPSDFNEHLTEGLGSDLTRTMDLFTLMSGCVGMYSSVRVCLDHGVPLGTVRRSVGF
jgi:hypothetical protein